MGMDIFLYTKTPGGFIRIQLILSMDMRELDMVKYIQSYWRLVELTHTQLSTVKYNISRTNLQEIVFPLIHHGVFFLTRVCRRRSLRFAQALGLDLALVECLGRALGPEGTLRRAGAG
jgi:hypothetical protein